jgi:aquaporin related protein
MQNPLRRPGTNASHNASHRNRDLERNRQDKTNDGYLPKDYRAHLVAMSGEFVGTFMFLFFAFAATQIANTLTPSTEPNLNQLLFISLAFGFSLAVTAWVFYRISGGLFNPAVTFGMVITGTLPALRGALLFPAQILGGMVAAAVVSCLFPGTLAVQTTLTNGTSIAQGLFIEMFLTAELVFTVLMLAAEKSKATFIAPVGIGLSLFVAELAGVYFTGGSLNPARSFGPCVANRDFQGYHWIYWVGPFLGALISGGYYKFVKFNNYEEANPGQDDSHHPQDVVEKRR